MARPGKLVGNILMPLWLPTASAEFMVLEEDWNISKNDLLALSY
jgi:hypothetical protein